MTIKDEKMINLIGFARQMNCTDIHISMNSPAMLRRRGELIKTNFEATNDEIRKMILSMLSENGNDMTNECTDLISTFETPLPDSYRQRVSVFRQANQIAASIRLLPDVGQFMEEDGILIISGIIDIRKEDVLNAVKQNNFTIVEEAYRENWCAFTLKK